VIGLLAFAAAAAIQPQTVLTIDPKHRLVEGVTSDGQTIWVSSILDRQILACRATCRTIATLPAPLHPFAIAWDASRKRLWVAADCPPGVAAIKPCERGALMALSSGGRVLTRIATASGSFHPGDVSAAPQGVFVSDSQNGAVYRLTSSGYSLEPVIAPGTGKSAQGTALDAEGQKLLVADYSQGVGVIDLATGTRTLLPRQDGKPLRGVDGLARCGANYFGIYNGSAPGILVSITLEGSRLHFEQPLGDVTLPDPTQVTYDGKRLLIVADSGWATLDKPGFVRSTGAPIVAVPLSGDCKPT
jgi:DNA-binding beta-propeller fold protein YncE